MKEFSYFYPLLGKYADVFQKELGEIKDLEAKIFLKEGATHRFFKARPVPYSMREKVEKELHRLQSAGIITRVEFADWAAPIVPVVKFDGTIRVCGDCKMTVNQAAKVDRYPLPLIDNFFAQVGEGKIFTTLHMSYPTSKSIYRKVLRSIQR